MRIRSLAALMSVAALVVASPVLAHTELVRSNPAANATVKAPRTITLTFNERVVPAFSKFELSMPEHNMTVPLTTTVTRDGKRIVANLGAPLMKGSYRINWTAAGRDGHKMTGHYNFRVG